VGVAAIVGAAAAVIVRVAPIKASMINRKNAFFILIFLAKTK
jgi:hypothetical protein